MNLDDIYDIGIAAEYRAPDWTMYAGISHQEGIVNDENRLISLPADDSWKLGIGCEWPMGDERYFGFAYELAVIDNAPLSQTYITGNQTLEGEMSDYYIHFISAAYRF
jgi:long-subunit fatty acid transport protein